MPVPVSHHNPLLAVAANLGVPSAMKKSPLISKAKVKKSKLQQRTQEKRVLAGRQVAWMIREYFKVSDTDESLLDRNEILKVGSKNDNVESFSTR